MRIPDKFKLQPTFTDVQSVVKALDADVLSGNSTVIDAYEVALAQAFNSPYCVAAPTGSAAIHTALACLGVGPGDEVLLPSIAPIPSILPVLSVGARPVFVDINSYDDHSVPWANVERAISPSTRAMIFVPLWGYPSNYAELVERLRPYEIATIEDACQAHHSFLGERMVGTIADIGCFSTHDRKLLPTGEGGFLVCKTEAIAASAKEFVKLGGMKGFRYGPNYKLSALPAALGHARIAQLADQVLTRSRNAAAIKAGLEGGFWQELRTPEGTVPNYYLLALTTRVENPIPVQQRCAELGLSSDYVNYGVGQYRKELFGAADIDMPNAIDALRRTMTLPTHPGLTGEHVEQMCCILNAVAAEFQ